MNIPYYHVDAFAGRLFAGNPAGVCILEKWLPEAVMQSIATENNLSETAFVVPCPGGFHLRWFTPQVEIDLCGHATLATSHVLSRHCGHNESELRFQTRSGWLTVARDGERLTLDFPARPALPCSPPEDLAAALGAIPAAVLKARDYLAVFESDEQVRLLKPDMAAVMRLGESRLIVTAPGRDCDFVSRFFAPQLGIPEDPVTGSAHCTLIPYWASRLGRKEMLAWQVSARGGELFCQERGERVGIAGRALTYLSGLLHIDPSALSLSASGGWL
jgi:PhzF family phenazine biosynthesis protein